MNLKQFKPNTPNKFYLFFCGLYKEWMLEEEKVFKEQYLRVVDRGLHKFDYEVILEVYYD